jgi:hypothetical protein
MTAMVVMAIADMVEMTLIATDGIRRKMSPETVRHSSRKKMRNS